MPEFSSDQRENIIRTSFLLAKNFETETDRKKQTKVIARQTLFHPMEEASLAHKKHVNVCARVFAKQHFIFSLACTVSQYIVMLEVAWIIKTLDGIRCVLFSTANRRPSSTLNAHRRPQTKPWEFEFSNDMFRSFFSLSFLCSFCYVRTLGKCSSECKQQCNHAIVEDALTEFRFRIACHADSNKKIAKQQDIFVVN